MANIFEQVQTSISDPQGGGIVSGFTPTPQTVDPTAALIEGLGNVAEVGGKVRDSYVLSKLSDSMAAVDTDLQSEVSDYMSTKKDLANVVKSQTVDQGLSEEDKSTLQSLQKDFQRATDAKRNKLISSGDLDTRLNSKVRSFISNNPHLSGEARSLLSGYKGTGDLPPEIKGMMEGREDLAKKMAAEGLNVDNPVQYADYIARERAVKDAQAASAIAAGAIANAKAVSGEIINTSMVSVEKQLDLTVKNWKLKPPINKEQVIADLNHLESKMLNGVNALMINRERSAKESGKLMAFDSTESDKIRDAVSGYIKIYKDMAEKYGDSPLELNKRMLGILQTKAQLSAPRVTALRAVYGDEGVNRILSRWDEVYGLNPAQYSVYLDKLPPSQRAATQLLRTMSPDTAISNIIESVSGGSTRSELVNIYGKELVDHVAKRNIALANEMHKEGKLDDNIRNVTTGSLEVMLNTDSLEGDMSAWDNLLESKPSEIGVMLRDPKINSALKNEFSSFLLSAKREAFRKIKDSDYIKVDENTGLFSLDTDVTGIPGREETRIPVGHRNDAVDAIENLNKLIKISNSKPFSKISTITSQELSMSLMDDLLMIQPEKAFTPRTMSFGEASEEHKKEVAEMFKRGEERKREREEKKAAWARTTHKRLYGDDK